MSPARFRAVSIVALLCTLLPMAGCELVDSQVLSGSRQYFPKAEIHHYHPRVLHIETKVGNVSPQFVAETFQAFAQKPTFGELRTAMPFAGYRYLVLGFDDSNAVWDINAPGYVQTLNAEQWQQWWSQTFGPPPTPANIRVVR